MKPLGTQKSMQCYLVFVVRKNALFFKEMYLKIRKMAEVDKFKCSEH